MSLNSQLASMLSRIQNGQLANVKKVLIENSKYASSILSVLYKEGLISGFTKKEESTFPKYEVYLKYYKGAPLMNKLECIARPGKHTYKTSKDLRKLVSMSGIYLLSTVEGVLTDKEAIRKGLGGKLLCKIS